jgi:chalcone isomerase-like protein
MKKGDRVTFTYEPGKGSTLTLRDETEKFEGKDFADAFLLLYVGPKPPRDDLKKGLLGQP